MRGAEAVGPGLGLADGGAGQSGELPVCEALLHGICTLG